MVYRKDIDGLRAIAVISVILFHLGFLPNGYLGVDVFFVISGYLITSIVYKESQNNKFSILKFYERRIRRIIPLTLVITSIALIIGLFLMLPDDLENLAQSVFASNFSVNNILMYITSSDYWGVKNDFKPLMHTWSLGIEEQFYLLYPFLFFFIKGSYLKYVKYILVFLTIISVVLFLNETNISAKFYFIQFRFFEMSIGGLAAIQFQKCEKATRFSKFIFYISILSFFLILFTSLVENNNFKTIIITLISVIILVLGKFHFEKNNIYSFATTNRAISFLGKISFSLYMWHQFVFAFARYSFLDEIGVYEALYLSIIILLLSTITYFTIENKFRDRNWIKTKRMLIVVILLFIVSSSGALYIYTIGGIIKDYPSLGIYKTNSKNEFNFFNADENIHIQYNEDARKFDKDFIDNGKVNVLVIGNSFGRDVVNVLRESDFVDKINISYLEINKITKDAKSINRITSAGKIFVGTDYFIDRNFLDKIESDYKIDINKNIVFMFGIKDFGYSNGIHFNKLNQINDFKNYRTNMKTGFQNINDSLAHEWGNHYINVIKSTQDENDKVLVFDSKGRFLSQDTAHLTKPGAQFYANLLKNRMSKIIFSTSSTDE